MSETETKVEGEPADIAPPSLPVPAPPADDGKSVWTETDDRALMLFAQDAKKSRSPDTDLFDDSDEDVWVDIAERFPGKSAINCLQRYARMSITELQEQVTSGTVANGVPSLTAGQKRDAEDLSLTGPDGKKAKVTEEANALWTDEETTMLKEMVTQFPNSEYDTSSDEFIYILNHTCSTIFISILIFLCSSNGSDTKME